jgi:murein L,D-transpeptidase YafK
MRYAVAILGSMVVAVGVLYQTSSSPSIQLTSPVDSLHVDKSARTLTAFHSGKQLDQYEVALSIDPTGPKRFEGDRRVPEGEYHIEFHVPNSIAHKALYISYPNREDRAYARRHDRSPGGSIEIHGLHSSMAWMGRFHTIMDYTLGCIAVTNPQIDALYKHVPDGTPIVIEP